MNSTLVTINDEPILLSDVQELLSYYEYSKIPNTPSEVDILDSLINNKVIKAFYNKTLETDEIKEQIKMQMSVVSTAVEEHCYKILNEYFMGNEKEFFYQVGTSIEDYIDFNVKTQYEQLITSLLMQKVATDKSISPETIFNYLNKNVNKNTDKNDKYEVSELVIYKKQSDNDKDYINKIYKELTNKNAKFELIADKYSDEDINLGWVDILKDDKPFNFYLLKLNKNEISNIIESDDAYYIIKWVDKKDNSYNVVGLTLYKDFYDGNKIIEFLNKIREDIISNKISWEDAVLKYSQNKENKNYYGVILNSKNSEVLSINDFDTSDFVAISKLNEKSISNPVKINKSNETGYRLLYVKKIYKNDKNGYVDFNTAIEEYNNLLYKEKLSNKVKSILKQGDVRFSIDLGIDICKKWFMTKYL